MRSNIGGTVQLPRRHPRPKSGRQHARQVLHDAAAGDVGDALDPMPRGQGADQRGVDPGGLQQFVRQRTCPSSATRDFSLSFAVSSRTFRASE